MNEKAPGTSQMAAGRLAPGGPTQAAPAAAPRLPPGQSLTTKFPILDLGFRPPIALDEFGLAIDGEVEQPMVWDWRRLTGLPKLEQASDFHCVTRWSKLDVRWGGVPFRTVCEQVRPRACARFVVQYGRDGYSTNVPLDEMLSEDVLLAYELDGRPLPLEHGGPVRIIVPKLYAWKGAKFLRRLEFLAEDRPGFWESRGYHNHGDPWSEERLW